MTRPLNSKRNCSMVFEQKDIMIKFLTANPQLSSGKFDSKFTYKTAQNLWQQLTLQLNCTKGPTKDWKEWRKTWQDMKTRAKYKNLKIRQSAVKTGEELPVQNQLNSLEEHITAQLISKASLARLADMEESGSCVERSNDATTSFPTITTSMEFSETEQSETEYSAEEEQSVGVDSGCDVNTTVTSPRKLFTQVTQLQRTPDVTSTITCKEDYYNKKLVLLERLAVAEERKAAAQERKAIAEERKAVAEERKVAVEERMVAVEERKVAAEERKAAVLEHSEMKGIAR